MWVQGERLVVLGPLGGLIAAPRVGHGAGMGMAVDAPTC